jgi:hypothetical protein
MTVPRPRPREAIRSRPCFGGVHALGAGDVGEISNRMRRKGQGVVHIPIMLI